jgi:hypothetical protein
MKRIDLVRHLERNGCALLREGAKRSLFVNRAGNKASTAGTWRSWNRAVQLAVDTDVLSAGIRQPTVRRSSPTLNLVPNEHEPGS